MSTSLVRKALVYGYLRTPCASCGQQMVVARSGKCCLNCTEVKA